MGYSELIKNFERIRDYVHEFYVYGYKTRSEYDKKSPRSYDNERRRLESWLGDHISSHRTAKGKNVFLSIDSRAAGGNPLYRVFKSKSFTDGDITLHFILFDILRDGKALSLGEITKEMDEYLSGFETPQSFDGSTVRKKLSEYINLGVITSVKDGRRTLYKKSPSYDLSSWRDALEFFSEAGMCGVVGSFLLDGMGGGSEYFTFKHHYVTHVLESEVLCALFEAISEGRTVKFGYYRRKSDAWFEQECVPLKIFVSVQTGRRWLAGYSFSAGKQTTYRLDYLRDIRAGAVCPQFDALRNMLDKTRRNLWGVSQNGGRLERVCFTLKINEGEEHVFTKLERERRIGTVSYPDKTTAVFTALVYDSTELVPWIRSFIGYISALDLSNKAVERIITLDTERMYKIYGITENAVS